MNKYFLKDLFEKPISGEWGKELENGIIGFPVIRTTNFTNIGEINYDDLAYRDIDPIKKENKFLKLGDIIIEKSGGTPDNPVGRVVYFNKKEKNFFTNNFTAVLRSKNNADSKYLFYLLYYLHKRKVVLKYQNKTTGIINLQLNDYLKKTEVEIPTLSMQKETVDLLDGLRNLIKIRKEQIQTYDDLIESLFFEMFGNPITNNKHFKTNKFINVVKLKRGYDLPVKSRIGNKYEVYGSNGVLDGHNEFKVEEPGVITGRSGTIGKVYRNEGMYWPLNTTLYSEKTYGNNVIFLEYLLKNFKLERFATGTGVPTLNRNIVHKEEIIEVPIELQNKFADYVLKIEEEKKKLNSSLLELESLFDSLMEDAFSGNLFKD